ncbi:hypothetical protein ABPG72_005946 [Tetrahymena utriculariae]
MINRLFKKFDIFAQSFQFNSSKQNSRKRTCFGGILSLIIAITTLIYFFYLNYQYFNNQFPPKFRSQSFIVNDSIDITLDNGLMGFQFKSFTGNNTLDQIEAQQNKTYLVFIPVYVIQTPLSLNTTLIDIVQCSNPQLQGYKCLNLSNLTNKYVTNDNNNQIFSYISIGIYRCQDTDYLKQTIPDNCASEEDISSYLLNQLNTLNIKAMTSQYNTTSKTIQTYYKNYNILIPRNEVANIEVRAQKHITKVKEGPLIQGEQLYSSPISYIVNTQTIGSYKDSAAIGASRILSLNYDVDELVQQIDIQFSTYPEVLALCNSTLALLMCVGFLGRQMAQQVITQELFLFTLQNIYRGTFQKILKVNNLQVYDDIIQLEGLSQNFQAQNQSNEEHQGQLCVPSFTAKHQEFTLNSKRRITYNDKFQDEIKESIITETNTQYSPKINALTESSNFKQENSLLQPQIVFENKINAYQFISKDIELQNSQQSSKLQNIQVESKKQDLCKKYNLLNSISSRIYSQELSKKIEGKLFSLKQIFFLLQNINVFNNSVSKFSIKKRLFSKKKHFEKKGLNQTAVQSINSQVANTLDFISFYKDILLLKKAIMVLLSKEQLAALELVGCTDMFLEGGNIDKIYHKGNHFEQQLTISQSEQLKCKYIEDFINQCQQSQNLSRIDQRIFSSLI